MYDEPLRPISDRLCPEPTIQLLSEANLSVDFLLAAPSTPEIPTTSNRITNFNTNTSDLPEVPTVNYDSILGDKIIFEKVMQNILENEKDNKTIADTVDLDLEEKKLNEELNSLFFFEKEPTEEPQNNGTTPSKAAGPKVQKMEVEETIDFFDINKSLAYTIPKHEDSEFIEFMTYLPECSDQSYHNMRQKL